MENSGLIFHYTSPSGMLGIIRNQKLWASDFAFMNDPEEIRYTANELRKRLNPLTVNSADEISKFLEFLSKEYADTKTSFKNRENRAFVTSFSNTDTHPTLWKSYAGKNGFCLGFDRVRLLEWLEFPGADLGEEEYEGRVSNYAHTATYYTVGYGPKARDKILTELIGLVTSSSFNFDANIGIVSQMLDAFASVKHHAYEDECETRLVLRNGNCHTDSKVRPSDSMGLIPYLELMFPPEALKKITLAPKQDFERAENGVYAALDDGGRGRWSHVAVEPHDVPFTW